MESILPLTSNDWRRRQENIQNETGGWLKTRVVLAVRKMELNGVKQALEPGILWIERLCWLAIFFACFSLAVYLTVATYIAYSQNPILNSFRDDEPIRKFPAPAITVTGTMILSNNATLGIDELFDVEKEARDLRETNFSYQGLTWTTRLIDILLFTMDHLCELVSSFANRQEIIDPSKYQPFKLENDRKMADHMNVTLHDDLSDNGLRETIIPYLKNRTLDCTKILAACWWEGNTQNCTDVFKPTQTDVGNGCTFNRIPDRLLRKQQGLPSIFNSHSFTEEEEKEWEKYDLDSVLSVAGMKNYQDSRFPRTQHEAGKLSGLSFLLLFDEDDASSCPIVDSKGYLIGIHSPFEEPRLMQTGITVPPLVEAFAKVKTEATFADQEIRSLSIEKRKCYFQDENPLSNFNFYTKANCHQECLATKIQTACKCLLLTQSGGDKERLCGPANAKCVKEEIAKIREKGYDQICQRPVCHSPCTEVKYDADVSLLPYYNGTYFNEHFRELTKNRPTSIVHITQASDSVPIRERKLQFGFNILFGVIGGIWGMIFDVSMFSVFNVLAGLIAYLFPKYFKTGPGKSILTRRVNPRISRCNSAPNLRSVNTTEDVDNVEDLNSRSENIAANAVGEQSGSRENDLFQKGCKKINAINAWTVSTLQEVTMEGNSSSSSWSNAVKSLQNLRTWDGVCNQVIELSEFHRTASNN